jgi:Ca-activated chloride channel family protein
VSGALAALHFIRPWWLLLLLPGVGLWWLERRQGDTTPRWRRVIDPALLRHLIIAPSQHSVLTPINLLTLGWIIAAVAVAGPTWRREPSPFSDTPPPAVIVLRVTPSMTTPDLPPTRLERAQQKIADLLELREAAATGLVAYSGSAHLVLPPTADAEVVRTMARALSPQIMPQQGDRLADAVALARQILADDRHGGSIVILADTAAPDQLQALRAMPASQRPTTLLLATLPPAKIEAALTDAAKTLNADLVRVTPDRGDVESIARQLARTDRLTDVTGQGERWQDAGYWLVVPLVLLVLAAFRRGWMVAG